MRFEVKPDDYPENLTVPPNNSAPINKKLYRLVENTIPNSADFLASYKDPSQKHLIKKESIRNNPEFYGTSFFMTEDAIQALIDGSPERFKTKKVAVGQVNKNHGVAKNGRKKHVSVWFFENTYPQDFILA